MAGHYLNERLPDLCESLLLPRYQVDRGELRAVTVNAARELAALIEETGASIRGVELEASRTLAGLPVRGRADLVLEAPDVVIDLKWGISRYRDKLRTGTALQLAAYAELLARGRKRPEAAYFALRRQVLLGEPGCSLPNAEILGEVGVRDTWRGATRALAERLDELNRGDLAAPGATDERPESRLEGDRLHLAPDCDYCNMHALCGRGGYR